MASVIKIQKRIEEKEKISRGEKAPARRGFFNSSSRSRAVDVGAVYSRFF